jgi:hypothetical protein
MDSLKIGNFPISYLKVKNISEMKEWIEQNTTYTRSLPREMKYAIAIMEMEQLVKMKLENPELLTI